MKILVVTEGAYPESIGGSQSLVYEMIQGLKARNHEIFHVTSSPDSARRPLEKENGVEVRRYYLPGTSYFWDMLLLPFGLLSAVNRTLRRNKCDLILMHHVMSGFWVSLFLKRKYLLIYNFNSPWYLEYEIRVRRGKTKISWFNRGISWVLKNIQKTLMRNVKHIVALSDYMKQMAAEMEPSAASKIVIFRTGLNPDEFKPAEDRDGLRQRLGMNPSAFILLAVRRLVPRMGLDLLIAAMPSVLNRYPETELWIVGRGILSESLKAKAESLGLERQVRFLGFKEKPELIETYQGADLTVMPSVDLEGFGFSTIESLACGTPVVGTASGGTSEILSKLDPRFLVPQAEPGKLSESLCLWISRRDELRAWRQKARALVEQNYTREKMIDDLEQVFHRKDS